MKLRKVIAYLVLSTALLVALAVFLHCLGRFGEYSVEKRAEWTNAKEYLCLTCGISEECNSLGINKRTQEILELKERVSKDREVDRLCRARTTLVKLNPDYQAVMGVLSDFVPCGGGDSSCGILAVHLADKMYSVLFVGIVMTAVVFLLTCSCFYKSWSQGGYTYIGFPEKRPFSQVDTFRGEKKRL